MRGGPDRLAEDQGIADRPGSQDGGHARQPSPGCVRLLASMTRPAASEPRTISPAPASMLGRQRPASPGRRPRRRAPRHRDCASADQRQGQEKAARVSVITNRLCQTRTGSQATIAAAASDRAGRDPPLPAADRRQPDRRRLPRARCRSAIRQRWAAGPRITSGASSRGRAAADKRSGRPFEREPVSGRRASVPAAGSCPGRRSGPDPASIAAGPRARRPGRHDGQEDR